MAEYIDRNYIGKAYIDLCKALSQKSKICPGANEPTVKDVFALVMHAPAADVVEVRHGRWMDAESDDGCTVWHCSACSCPVKTIGGYPIYRHCPMCGARMDKEDDHEAG